MCTFQLGVSPHNLKTFNGVNDGAEMNIEKGSERHYHHFAIAEKGSKESGAPKPKHKRGRGEPNRQSDFDDEFH